MSDLEEILNTPMESGSHGPVPESLQHLFGKDPLGFAKQDIKAICEVLRTQQRLFLTEELEAKTAQRRPNYKKATKIDTSKIEF